MLKYCGLLVAVLILVPVIHGIGIDSEKDDEPTTTLEDENLEIKNSDVEMDDMLLTKDQNEFFYGELKTRRNGITNPLKLWPDATVAFELDPSMKVQAIKSVLTAMFYIQSISCVKFVKRNERHQNYVTFVNGNNCRSRVGMQKGKQLIIVSPTLCYKGNVVHEILHTLGFVHMHTSIGRDEFITINWSNIRKNSLGNFKIQTTPTEMFNTPYDFASILHYPTNAFAIDNKVPTIFAKTTNTHIGQRKYMTPGDIIRLNRLYKCPEQYIQVLKKLVLEDNIELSDNENPLNINELFNSFNELENMDKFFEDGKDKDIDTKIDDMVLNKNEIDFLYSKETARRNGLTNEFFNHWPNAIVYYKYHKLVPTKLKELIATAMKDIEDVSCIQFQVQNKNASHENYVQIHTDGFCSSNVGMRNVGMQELSLDPDRCSKGNIIHELLHTLGFLHMHTAKEHKDYIEIKWDNIKESDKINFQQVYAHVSMFNTSYDIESIMHYSPKAYAIDKSNPTIVAINSHDDEDMGQRKRMSEGDILRLNRMYKCEVKNRTSTKDTEKENLKKIVKTIVNDPTAIFEHMAKVKLFEEQESSLNDFNGKNTFTTKISKPMSNTENRSRKKKFYQDPLREWPNGIVYYEYSKTVKPKFRETMAAAMKDIQDVSCIQFKLKNSTVDYWINFFPSRHIACSVTFDAPSLDFQMQIADDHSTKGQIIHDLLHTLGFVHMDIANERDNHIRIKMDNVEEPDRHYFTKVSSPVSLFNTSYDINSIMHSPPTAFAENKSIPTIIPLDPLKAKNMGQREKLSTGDILRLNHKYKCLEKYIAVQQGVPMRNNTGEKFSKDNGRKAFSKVLESKTDLNKTIKLDDMILNEKQVDILYVNDRTKKKEFFNLWPDAVVYYKYHKLMPSKVQELVAAAMKNIEDVSCIQFKVQSENATHKNYVQIQTDEFSSSNVGMNNIGMQKLSLSPDRFSKGNIIHELLHTLGFLHMHTANERDQHIEINWDNVMESDKTYYAPVFAYINMYNTNYDTVSIMHYSPYASAIDKKKPTIIALKPHNTVDMGQRERMSEGDIHRLNRMYKCEVKNLTLTKETGKKNLKKIVKNTVNDPTTNLEQSAEVKLFDGQESSLDDFYGKNSIKTKINKLPEKYLESAEQRTRKQKFYQDPLREWPNGIVYYEYSKTVKPKFRETMAEAMKDIQTVSCIQFKLKNSTVDYWIKFYPSRHIACSLTFDAPSLDFQMQIADDHSTKGQIIHDLLHTLGFVHMDIANERDNHIRIKMDNVEEPDRHYFTKVSSPVSLFNTSYDINSIMHSPPTAFAENKSIPTIIPLDPLKAKNMGQREKLSTGDILRLNHKYKCLEKYIAVQQGVPIRNTTNEKILKDNGIKSSLKAYSQVLESKNDLDKTIKLDDMILNEKQVDILYVNDKTKKKEFFNLWPDAVVYYKYNNFVPSKIKELVTAAMKDIEDVSCIQFKVQSENASHKNYVQIQTDEFSSSNVGMNNIGMQKLSLSPDRCYKGNVIHELLHTLGFLHMHTANERDKHININWDNVMESDKTYFEPVFAHVNMYDTNYDTVSIMHYSPYASAIDKKKPTIIALKPHNTVDMGQRERMSEGDILRLNRMYKCKDKSKNDEEKENIDDEEILKRIEITTTTETISKELEIVNDFNDVDDMILNREQMDELYSPNAAKRNGLKTAFHHWANALVYFEYDTKLGPEFVESIHEAMIYISNISCVKFEPRQPNNRNYIFITEGAGCSSEVGMRNSGRQLLNLNPKLCSHGKIVHELLHSLGFLHMHTANDRDDFLVVNWDNIKDSAVFNFHQFKSHVSMFGTNFDYDSILHYSEKAFAKDKSKPTLIPIYKDMAKNMGQRIEMSQGDISRLNRMYKCPIPESTNPDTQITEIPAEKNQNLNSTSSQITRSSVTPEETIKNFIENPALQQNKKEREILNPNAMTEKHDKPCDSKTFITFLFNIRE